MPTGSARARLGGRFIRFAGVGAIGTLAHYVVLILLISRLGAGAVRASSAGFVIGALVNYLLNYRLTFRSRRPHMVAAPMFFSVAFVGFWLNAGAMTVLEGQLDFHYLAAQALATSVTLLWNFLVNNFVTFREDSCDR